MLGVKALDVISKNCLCFLLKGDVMAFLFLHWQVCQKAMPWGAPRLSRRMMTCVLLSVAPHLPKNPQKNVWPQACNYRRENGLLGKDSLINAHGAARQGLAMIIGLYAGLSHCLHNPRAKTNWVKGYLQMGK